MGALSPPPARKTGHRLGRPHALLWCVTRAFAPWCCDHSLLLTSCHLPLVDWLPTWVFGIARQPASVATGPRPLDGHDLWGAWTSTSNQTSPRTEVIHQVSNRFTDANCQNASGLPPICHVA